MISGKAQLHATSSQFIFSIFPVVQEKKFHPEEISSMILLKMKETAEAYLGAKINDAVACTLVPCEASATAACSSNNFSAILLKWVNL